jgi:hypothetical protein
MESQGVLARLCPPADREDRLRARAAELIAARYPDRTVNVVGDAAYAGEHLRNLGDQITWTSRGLDLLEIATEFVEVAASSSSAAARPGNDPVALPPGSRTPSRARHAAAPGGAGHETAALAIYGLVMLPLAARASIR